MSDEELEIADDWLRHVMPDAEVDSVGDLRRQKRLCSLGARLPSATLPVDRAVEKLSRAFRKPS
jgi:hypothetical protein